MQATLEMLPDAERDGFATLFREALKEKQRQEAGLTEAIRRILQEHKRWISVSEVRDRLVESGFDFSEYKANPLASISTTLKRMKPDEVETAQFEGVAAYRWIKRPARNPLRRFRLSKPRLAELDEARKVLSEIPKRPDYGMGGFKK